MAVGYELQSLSPNNSMCSPVRNIEQCQQLCLQTRSCKSVNVIEDLANERENETEIETEDGLHLDLLCCMLETSWYQTDNPAEWHLDEYLASMQKISVYEGFNVNPPVDQWMTPGGGDDARHVTHMELCPAVAIPVYRVAERTKADVTFKRSENGQQDEVISYRDSTDSITPENVTISGDVAYTPGEITEATRRDCVTRCGRDETCDAFVHFDRRCFIFRQA